MTKLDSALWRDMMDYLRRRHAPICRQWFEELEPLELSSGLLRIHTSNGVQQTYLDRKCREQFTEAVQATTGLLLSVRFVTGQDGVLEHQAAAEAEPFSTAALATAIPAPGSASAPAPEMMAGHAGGMLSGHSGGGSAAVAEPHGDEAGLEQVVISPDYTFETFITGPGNQLAYAASFAVANQPGTAYNPLFIHGGVGLGKTHLLQAICQTILHKSPGMRICYLSCDTFMNQFLDCVQRGQMAQFRGRYRHVDVLVIDDIHFLANKERTQEEFFHTFNALYQLNKQIVLSSDSPPNEIPQLEERLVSRFNWGLVTNVSKPCYETRVAIVRAKAKVRALEMPDDVVSFIAAKIESNARELEGAITTIQGHAALQNRAIDLGLAREALGEPAGGAGMSQVTLQNIIDAVTRCYNVKLSDLQSKRRHKSITEPRQVCMWLARRRTRFSLEEIGGYFGGRDHTTVMHSIRTVDERASVDATFAQIVSQLEGQVQPSKA